MGRLSHPQGGYQGVGRVWVCICQGHGDRDRCDADGDKEKEGPEANNENLLGLYHGIIEKSGEEFDPHI